MISIINTFTRFIPYIISNIQVPSRMHIGDDEKVRGHLQSNPVSSPYTQTDVSLLYTNAGFMAESIMNITPLSPLHPDIKVKVCITTRSLTIIELTIDKMIIYGHLYVIFKHYFTLFYVISEHTH